MPASDVFYVIAFIKQEISLIIDHHKHVYHQVAVTRRSIRGNFWVLNVVFIPMLRLYKFKELHMCDIFT